MSRDELLKRVYNDFTYHTPTEEQVRRIMLIRSGCLGIATILVDLCPQGRELSTALTHLEAVMMNANAGIVRNKT